MSEPLAENPNQVVQPGADDEGTQTDEAQTQQPTSSSSTQTASTEYPIRLVKQETGDVHWNVAKGVWEKITHAETGEPNAEYVLLATIDGADIPLASYNAGRIETVVRSQQQAQSQQSSGA